MSIKSILLHVDATPAAITRLEVTIALAERLGARVTAAFAAAWEDQARFSYSAASALESEGGRASDQIAARARLQRHHGGEAAHVAWCDIVGAPITPGFLAEALFADLLVVGQQPRVAEPGAAPPGFAESVVLQGGRPTLVVPASLRRVAVARRVVVAWNGSLPAARALGGALPLLQRADAVHVVSWTRQPVLAPFSGIDVREYLGRHGVRAEIRQQAASSNVGRDLAGLAHELSADLIVMGCYGHSRASERVFGGTSRSILATADVCVLMAH